MTPYPSVMYPTAPAPPYESAVTYIELLEKKSYDDDAVSDITMFEDEDEDETIDCELGDFVRVPLTKLEFVLVYAGLLLTLFVASLDDSILSTALKAIVEEFGQQGLVSWIGSAYLLTAAPMGILSGKLADIFGRKCVLLWVIGIFEVGSLLSAVSNSMEQLIMSRAVSGIGAGGIFSMVLIVVSDIISLRDRGKYQILMSIAFGLSSLVAPLIGGLFADHSSWRWCFYINLPLGAITLLIITVCLNFPPEESVPIHQKFGQIDYLGSVLLFSALICLITPLQLGGTWWSWNSPVLIVMIILCPILMGLFVYVECKVAKEPIVPPSLFVNATVPSILVIMLALGAVKFSGIYYLSSFFQVVYGISGKDAGLRILPALIGSGLLSILSGFWVSKMGTYKFFIPLGSAITMVGIVLISRLDSSSSLAEQFISLALFGMGLGCTINTRMVALQASVPQELIAIATAVGQSTKTIGSAIGIAITGSIFNNMAENNMASASSLQSWVEQLNHDGISTSSADALQLIHYLKIYESFYPRYDDPAATIYNATLAAATSELTAGFGGAFSTTYLWLLPYPILVLGLSFFVKEFALGRAAKKNLGENSDEEA
ncbi:hypothetical protein HDU98_003294 [Podochytrium sp. JEL0797]|nr:hypothetical protein HDU98_003294 [Podochytrium sp. JEL0797]